MTAARPPAIVRYTKKPKPAKPMQLTATIVAARSPAQIAKTKRIQRLRERGY